MHYFHLLAFPLTAVATLNGHCSGSEATGAWASDGICIDSSTCIAYNGDYINGGCPYDPDPIKCCLVGVSPDASVNPCGGVSICTWTSNGCTGTWKPGELYPYLATVLLTTTIELMPCHLIGYCPGGSNYECCYLES